MPRITAAYTSNYDESFEPTEISKKGRPSHWPPLVHANGEKGGEAPVTAPVAPSAPSSSPVEAWGTDEPIPVAAQKAAGVAPEDTVTIADQKAGTPPPLPPEGSDPSSAGTSSSVSDKRPDRSGSSAPETEPSLQSPVPSAESLSGQDQPTSPAPSSTASSTSGSTQETGPSQPDQSDSSEESTAQTPATPRLSPNELIQAARQAYERKDWDMALQLLADARDQDASVQDVVATARQAIATARAADEASQGGTQGASEETPSAGGFTVA